MENKLKKLNDSFNELNRERKELQKLLNQARGKSELIEIGIRIDNLIVRNAQFNEEI